MFFLNFKFVCFSMMVCREFPSDECKNKIRFIFWNFLVLCTNLKVKIQFEALQPFCGLQIFSAPKQMCTHPQWAFIPDYT